MPGFFGFADLGELGYFGHVSRWLHRACTRRALTAQVHVVRTAPTASLVRRAERVHDTVIGLEPGPVHLIGHSSGGLDARVLCTPGAVLRERNAAESAERVRSVTTIATPHRGTPLARVFQGVRGRRLLRTLSTASLATLSTGERNVGAAVKLAGVIQGLAERTVGSPDLVNEVFDTILDGFDDERRQAVHAFFAEVGEDTSLVGQLNPEALHPLTVLAPDRPGVAYNSVLTRSPTPTVGGALRQGVSVRRQAANALYASLYRVAASGDRHLDGSNEETLRVAFGGPLNPGANDAIVPTRSQPWGRVIAAANADHLDVLGHFRDRDVHPPHYDWLPSGAGFDQAGFDRVWDAIMDAVVEASGERTSVTGSEHPVPADHA